MGELPAAWEKLAAKPVLEGVVGGPGAVPRLHQAGLLAVLGEERL